VLRDRFIDDRSRRFPVTGDARVERFGGARNG
jgi:hypothetical protein